MRPHCDCNYYEKLIPQDFLSVSVSAMRRISLIQKSIFSVCNAILDERYGVSKELSTQLGDLTFLERSPRTRGFREILGPDHVAFPR